VCTSSSVAGSYIGNDCTVCYCSVYAVHPAAATASLAVLPSLHQLNYTYVKERTYVPSAIVLVAGFGTDRQCRCCEQKTDVYNEKDCRLWFQLWFQDCGVECLTAFHGSQMEWTYLRLVSGVPDTYSYVT
jgi:hypothetical protein